MAYSKVIPVQTGHIMFVSEISENEFLFATPEVSKGEYTKFYRVQNFDAKGCVFFYMAKGYNKHPDTPKSAAKEIHVWYRNSKKMWAGSGTNLQNAIEGAQKDGWLYT